MHIISITNLYQKYYKEEWYGEELLKGVVKRWIKSRGYGFIQPEGGTGDILVHHKNLEGMYELKEGQKVEFEVDETSQRPKAISVRVIN